MNWGRAIFLVMTAFVLLMAWFAWQGATNYEAPEADYYEKSLLYGEEVEARANAESLGGVSLLVVGERVQLTFPEVLRGRPITGEALVVRPSDARMDQRFTLSADTSGVAELDLTGAMKGHYQLVLDWEQGGTPYHSEHTFYLR